MTTLEISSFAEVILFEMQREKRVTMNFSEIWKACARSDFARGFQPDKFAKPFVAAIRSSLAYLERRSLIVIVTKEDGEKVRHVALTAKGNALLAETVFAHQQRMGTAD